MKQLFAIDYLRLLNRSNLAHISNKLIEDMKNNSSENKQVNPIIGQSQKITNSSVGPSQAILPQQSNESLQAFSQNMVGFGSNTAANYMEQTLISTMNKLKSGKLSQGVFDQSEGSQLKNKQIYLRYLKDRALRNKLCLLKNSGKNKTLKQSLQKWKERIISFANQMRNKLRLAKVREQSIQKQFYLFCKESIRSFKYNRDIRNQFKVQKQHFKKCLKKKNRSKLYVDQSFKSQKTNILNLKLSIFNINQNFTFHEEKMYSILAMQFFKVIHQNKMLAEVTLKGVQLLSFQQLIKVIYQTSHQQKSIDDNYKWIKGFAPSKQLKLAIYAQVSFQIQNYNKDQILSQISYLTLVRLKQIYIYHSFWYYQAKGGQIDFNNLGSLGNQSDQSDQENQDSSQQEPLIDDLRILEDLWKCLRSIKRLKLLISCSEQQQSNEISSQQYSFVRSMVFGGLSSFTEIEQLSFQEFIFYDDVCINDFLAIQQSLTTLFRNNKVTHLELRNCQNFPTLPKITTLQSIYVQDVNFRQQFNFMKSIIELTHLYDLSFASHSNSKLQLVSSSLISSRLSYQENVISMLKLHLSHLLNSNISTLKLFFKNQPYYFRNQIKLLVCQSMETRMNFREFLLPTCKNFISVTIILLHALTCKQYIIKWPLISILSFYNCRSLIIDVQTILKFKHLSMLKLETNIFREKEKDLMRLLNLGIQVDISPY